MKLPFSQGLNGIKTNFDLKILKGLLGANIFSVAEVVGYYSDYSKKELLKHPLNLHSVIGKIHTIREDKKDRWSAGKLVHAVFNNRSKKEYQFAPVFTCKSVQTIEMQNGCIWVGGSITPLASWELEELAKNDGFKCVADFWDYFGSYDKFEGKIIHFTNHKY